MRKDREPLTLSIYSAKKTQWDLFIMILATYNCIQIPLEVAFDPLVLRNSSVKATGVTIDLVFLLDIVISFRTTFIS